MKTHPYLDSLRFIKLGLDRVKKSLEILGNPQNKIKLIHVAGTNGKGSVCSMISSILTESGLKTGLYTSPHLIEINERIKINNTNISDDELNSLFELVKEKNEDEGIQLTYYEFLTVVSFYYFYIKKVDFAVIEVGLGGRLDATNLIKPLVSIITNIDYDHQNYLGNTLEEIANEKSGIIKEKIPVVTSAEGISLEVIQDHCIRNKSPLIIAKIIDSKDYKSPLQGEFQKINTSIVIKTIELLNLKIDNTTIKQGLKRTKWPGRLEFKEDNILMDCAHNIASIKELKRFITHINSRYRNINFILGILKDKDYKKMIKELSPIMSQAIITEPKNERALKAELIEKELKKYEIPSKIIKDVKIALKHGKRITNHNELLVISGSIYLLGEIFQELKP